MAFIDWHPELSVQVQDLDHQHHRLVDMLNALHAAMREGRSQEVVAGLVNGLKDYAKVHFSCEERYLQRLRYPEYDAHRAEHHGFMLQVAGFEKAMGEGVLSGAELLQFLKAWMVKHIKVSDRRYGPFLNAKGLH